MPGFLLANARVPPKLVTWLRQALRAGAQLCSVCTGAFPLGEAGALDDRTCTTHWRRVAELRARFPRARVVGDRLFVEDDGVVTSAGIAAGIDMTLALIEHDAGPVVAGEVARDLMRNPTMTLDAVAAACGFANGRQLRRVWSARYGKPPSAGRIRG